MHARLLSRGLAQTHLQLLAPQFEKPLPEPGGVKFPDFGSLHCSCLCTNAVLTGSFDEASRKASRASGSGTPSIS